MTPFDGPRRARVLAQYPDRWLVQPTGDGGVTPTATHVHASGHTPLLVPARGRLRDDLTGPPVTGDWVDLDEAGAIAHIHDRGGTIVRRAAGPATTGQVLAANVDLALVVEPLPEPNVRRAERLVALAAAGGVAAALVLTKADRAPDGDGDAQAAALARHLGVPDGLAVSAPTGEGVAILRTLLVLGETAVLLGPSGAGKSTLANALLGADRQATSDVRAADDRGRHTTVTRELLTLPHGALLIDTPGIREIGVWDDGTAGFADIDELAAGCRFADCAHDGEPGCAVAAGVDPGRLADWHKLRREQAWVDDRRAASRERERRGRTYSRLQREARKIKGGGA